MSVCMVEYQGRCDTEFTAVGHSPKVLMEYHDIVKDITDVSVYAPKTILGSIDRRVAKGAKVLPGYIVMKSNNSLYRKIVNKFLMFKNIRLALKNTEADTVWFFNVEFYFWLYMALHRKSKKRIVVTSFIGGFEGGFVAGVKQKIFEIAQKKTDLIIASGSNFNYKNCEKIYIPDYTYSEEKYGEYAGKEKEEYAVCLGTMGADKQLEPVIRAFNKNGYRLKIAGRFYDKNWVAELKNMANDNIEILDTYLSDEMYFDMLSKARYCILPYKPEKYGIQTSGVLQEAMFLNTVPVAFNRVLEGSNVTGVGIDSWEELGDEIFKADYSQLVLAMEERRNTAFDEKITKASYIRIFGR